MNFIQIDDVAFQGHYGVESFCQVEKCGKIIIKGGQNIQKDSTRVEGLLTHFQKLSCMIRRDDKLNSSPELVRFLRVCATLVNMRSAARTPAATKARDTSPVWRLTRGKALSQKDETESSSNDEELYELKPRKAKNLAMDLMHPMQDFQTHLDVTIEQNQKWLQDIGLQQFANLPWETYAQNIYAPTQLSFLQNSEQISGKEVEITAAFFAEQFDLPNEGGISWEKATDDVMQKEFGQPETRERIFCDQKGF